MSKVPEGYLVRPRKRGLVASLVVTDLLDTIERLDGRSARAALEESTDGGAAAEGPTVPEADAAALLRAVRRELPALSARAQRVAGRETAEALLGAQLSARGRGMLSRAPWPIAAWLLGRWADQHAWTFAGSGRFRALRGLEFEIEDNPFVRGEVAEGRSATGTRRSSGICSAASSTRGSSAARWPARPPAGRSAASRSTSGPRR